MAPGEDRPAGGSCQAPRWWRTFSTTRGSSMTAMTRMGFWQTGQRSGCTCQTRRIRSRHRLEGSFSGGEGERPGRLATSAGVSRRLVFELCTWFHGFREKGQPISWFIWVGSLVVPGLTWGAGRRMSLADATSIARRISWGSLPRQSRGDRREDIFLDDVDRQDFLQTLAEACQGERVTREIGPSKSSAASPARPAARHWQSLA